MKKLIICLVAVAMCAGAYAQKGTFAVGGTIGYETVKDGESSLMIAPSVDYFISDKLSVGVNIAYTNYEPNVGSSTSTFGVALSGTYYAKLADNFFFTPGAAIGIMTQKDVDTGVAVTAQLVGFEYRPVEKIGLTFGCGGITYASQGDFSSFGFTVNTTPTLGFRYLF